VLDMRVPNSAICKLELGELYREKEEGQGHVPYKMIWWLFFTSFMDGRCADGAQNSEP